MELKPMYHVSQLATQVAMSVSPDPLTQPDPKSPPTHPSPKPSDDGKLLRGSPELAAANAAIEADLARLRRETAEYACVYCKDKGVVTRMVRARSSQAIPCPKCGVEKIARNLQSVYPLPPEWENYDLADFAKIIKDGEERQYAQALRYAANPKGWIVFQGDPGTGKTMMFVGLMAAMNARGLHSLYLPARSLADLVYRALDPDADFTLQRLETDLRHIGFLIIDEACKTAWDKPFVHDTLFNILNWRYEHMALTAIAFNDDERIAGPSPALYSRMRDGRWGDGQGKSYNTTDDGIIRSTAKDVRPYLTSFWGAA